MSCRYIAISKFEPTQARKIFPCFDELMYKATFNISVWRKNGYTAFSNAELIKTEQM